LKNGAAIVGDVGVFQDVFDVLNDGVVVAGAADVLGGEGVADGVAGAGGLGGGVQALGEVEGRLGTRVSGRRVGDGYGV
jgi:hypothetical protein